jgi:hypothetical protein
MDSHGMLSSRHGATFGQVRKANLFARGGARRVRRFAFRTRPQPHPGFWVASVLLGTVACEYPENIEARSATVTTRIVGSSPASATIHFRAHGSGGTNEGYGEVFLRAEPETSWPVTFTPECTGTQADSGEFDADFDIAIPVARVDLGLDVPFEVACALSIAAPQASGEASIELRWFASGYVVVREPDDFDFEVIVESEPLEPRAEE